MRRRSFRSRRSGQSLNILFLLTFCAHLACTLYAFNAEPLLFFEHLRDFVATSYSHVGFEWSGQSAYIVTAALASSLFFNCARRFLEGISFGWPQFKDHDEHSLKQALISLLLYGLMLYFAVGFFGESYSNRPMDYVNIGIIALSTYIVGLLVDLLDDVVSGIFIIYFGDKA